jgi:hypothetical protein
MASPRTKPTVPQHIGVREPCEWHACSVLPTSTRSGKLLFRTTRCRNDNLPSPKIPSDGALRHVPWYWEGGGGGGAQRRAPRRTPPRRHCRGADRSACGYVPCGESWRLCTQASACQIRHTCTLRILQGACYKRRREACATVGSACSYARVSPCVYALTRTGSARDAGVSAGYRAHHRRVTAPSAACGSYCSVYLSPCRTSLYSLLHD